MSNAGPELAPNDSIPGLTPSPWANSTLWNTLYISGLPWWGRVEIRGAARAYQWDIKHSPGQEGYFETYRGRPHKPFIIRLFIWTDSMYSYWTNVFSKLLTYIGPLSPPLAVYHPSLQNLLITGIVVDELGAVEPVSDDMMFKVDIRVHEFLPEKPWPVTNSPIAVAPAPTPPATNPALAAIGAALVGLNEAAQIRNAMNLPASLLP